MGTTFPSATVIVVGFNSRDYLETCFSALIRQDYEANVELLFVDNESSDGSIEHVRAAFPQVRVIESGGNLGYAGGNNHGARYAAGDVLAFINPDTCADPTWLRELVRPLIEDRSVGLTTSKIVHMDRPDIINTCGNEISLIGITVCRKAGQFAREVETNEEVPAVSGAAFATWAILFKNLGGFDERFWMYLEDTDLSWRARRAGYRCILAARSVVKHEYSFSLSPAKTRQIECNRYLMLAKNLSVRSLCAMVMLLMLGELLTWGWAGLRGPKHLWAKLLACGWALAHIDDLWKANQREARMRRIPEGDVLRLHSPMPPITSIVSGSVGRVAAASLQPATFLLGAAALFIINIDFGLPQPSGSGNLTDNELLPAPLDGD